jgi:hypothetical protein
MKLRIISAMFGVGGTLLVTDSVLATYVGLTVSIHSTVNVGGGPKFVYRVYVNFSDANGYVTGVMGNSIVGPMITQNWNGSGTGLGSGFFNPGGTSSNGPPPFPGHPDEWGTFETIGAATQSQLPDQGSGIPWAGPTFIDGNQITIGNGGWFSPGPVEYGRSGWTGDGDSLFRVLIMQLSVNAGEHVKGTVSVSGMESESSGGFTAAAQTFSSIPGPGELATLGLAGLAGARRRR